MDEVIFKPLPTSEPVTTFTMTPDGAYLLMAHQAADLVSVWDVRQEKIVKTFATPSPRSIFCPGDQVFVANYTKGTISVFSIKDDWKQQDELKVDRDKVFYLSGPIGENFKNQLIAVCENENREEYNAYDYLIDTAHDKCREVSRASVATVSCDGKTVVTQGSFNLSPSGGMTVYPWDEFIGKNARAVSGIGDSITYAYPAGRGSYWITCASVYAGSPMSKIKEGLGMVIVPDVQQPLVYSLGDKILTANRLDTQLTEIGKRKVSFPKEEPQDMVRLAFFIYRHRAGVFDHPVACVHGNDLYLFAIDVNKSTIQYAKTTAFSASNSVASNSQNENQPKGDLGIPARIAAEKPWTCQLESGAQQRSFDLILGPDGMRLTSNGQLTWTPEERDVGVHELKIRRSASGVEFFRPTIEVVGKALVDARGGQIEKVDEFPKLELQADHFTIVPGREYRSLLLLQGNELKILKPDGFTVDRNVELPARYRWIAEREDCYVAVSTGPQGLDIIDKATLHVRKHVELAYPEVSDLAINPVKKLSYVAVKTNAERSQPQSRIVVVDESTGKITEPREFIGTWLTVDPTGSTLLAGYKDVFVQGQDVEIDPNWNVFEIRPTATSIC